jgi:hypothetical protein
MSTLAVVPRRTYVNCRVYERFPCDLPTACQPVATRNDKDHVWAATMRDISAGGVGLILPRRFEPGMGLQIELGGAGSGAGKTLLARVVYVRHLPDGNWVLGCAFISPLSENELEELLRLGKARRQQTSDPVADVPVRQESSAADNRKTTVIAVVTFQSEPVGGRVVRLRVNRLVVTGNWPAAPGTVLRIKVTGPDADPEADKVRVTRCWKQAGQWMVAYQFVGRPSAGLQRYFGHTVG